MIAAALMSVAANAYGTDKDSISSKDYFIEGVMEYCAGEYGKAETLLGRCIGADPENDAAYYYLAVTRLAAGDTDKALLYLNTASELSPENQWYRLAEARLYTSIGELDMAISIYNILIEDNPEKSDYYFELADLLVRNGKMDEALETIGRIEQLRGSSEITSNAKYEILMRQGRYDEAETVVRKMDEEYPSARTALILGDLYKARYNDSTALIYYKKALELDPEFIPAYFGLAEVYRMNRDFFSFFKCMNKFMASPQMSPEMKAQYMQEIIFPSGMVQVFRPQVDTLVENTLNASPTDTAVLIMAGSYYSALDSVEKGLGLLRRNVEFNPGVRSARTAYMGQLYYNQMWDTLIPVAEETVSMFPDDLTLAELLAIAYWQKGNISKAIKRYEDILSTIPKDHPMLLQCYGSLGDLYHEAGNNRKAYSCYEKGLSIDDNYSPILNNYAYFLSEDGRKLNKALEMSRKAVLNEPENSTYLDTYGWLLYLTGDYEEARKYLKKAADYSGKESAVILDHYAETLFALKEYNLAFLYWNNADRIDPELGLSKKIEERRAESRKKQ